jgi:hypothetical protein
MKLFGCKHERAAWNAALSGKWDPELRAHAACCRVCREVALVTSSLARLPDSAVGLPDPRLLWWRERWLRSREAERALKPVAVFQRVALVAAMLAAAAVAAAGLPALAGWVPVPSGEITAFGWTIPAMAVAAGAVAAGALGVIASLRSASGEE